MTMRSVLLLFLATPALAQSEPHLADLRQLTHGGENAEAYWSTDGRELIMQARGDAESCDRIYRMDVAHPEKPRQVSSGKGATTCSYFFPGDKKILYASTHLGGEACPPRPDHSQGYVWALYDSYDIFRANADGSGVERLTSTPGYDAEATVCAKDGSIVFTSVRDGDIDLYRMDKDGKNVRRLTSTPGYDGGAFFSHDCSKIVWRASRPKPGPELDEFRALLAKGLVRPSKLELWVANADGSEPTQITYLDAASFAPYWFPDDKRIIFSSNYGDPKGREFDLFAINIDGTGLERITHAPGFDGFPMFSPDGKWLAFSSNRATPPGKHDTNVFVARWVDKPAETAADRIAADVRWLADPARGGRGLASAGLESAGEYIERRFRELGLETSRQPFSAVVDLKSGPGTLLSLDGASVAADAFVPLGFSSAATVSADAVLAGYGIVAPEIGVDDYKGLDVRGKVVVVRRFVPAGAPFDKRESQARYSDLRKKAWEARRRGAIALVVVDAPIGDAKVDDARLPALHAESQAGLPAVAVKRAAAQPLLAKLAAGQSARVAMTVQLVETKASAFNVFARIPAKQPRAPTIVIGAHYDHLGVDDQHSLSPGSHKAHPGADDNASGTATVLEIARQLAEHRDLHKNVVLVAFSGEEAGLLGSEAFASHLPPVIGGGKQIAAMINLDMVGRMRENKLSILGGDTAAEWASLVTPACAHARVECTLGGDGYGPSDQTSFFALGVPVLHFFTGAHADYHKPSDTADKLNYGGAAQVAAVVAEVARTVDTRTAALTFKNAPSPVGHGDMRSFNASLGTVPDYAAPRDLQGVRLTGVRAGSAAEKGGLRRGDVLTHLGEHTIGSVEDLMYALNASKPGQTVTATLLRDGKEVRVDVTFEERKSH
jgi:Tol biopolymer transport system component